MPAVVWVVGGLAVVVGALLALDWVMAKHVGRRRFVESSDQNFDNLNVGVTHAQNQINGIQTKTDYRT